MKKSLFLMSILLFLCAANIFAQETITITTYYPSPYGSYNQLQVADKLEIGTNASPTYPLQIDNTVDIFANAPHEGNTQRNKAIGDKLIFSSEDDLDKKIASDPYLYKAYLTKFKEVLEILSPAVLKQVFENTYAELYPYYSNKDIISNSEFDVYKDADIDNLKSYLFNIYLQEKAYRDKYLNILKTGIISN